MPPPPGSDTSEALVALREARRVRAAKKGGPGGRPSQHQRERQVAHALFNWSNMGPRAQEVMDALDKWYPERDELRDPIRSTWRWLSMCARSSQDPSASKLTELFFYLQTNGGNLTGLIVLELPQRCRRGAGGIVRIRRTIVPPNEHGGAGTRLLQVCVCLQACVRACMRACVRVCVRVCVHA